MADNAFLYFEDSTQVRHFKPELQSEEMQFFSSKLLVYSVHKTCELTKKILALLAALVVNNHAMTPLFFLSLCLRYSCMIIS
jgi:hypothetical protein